MFIRGARLQAARALLLACGTLALAVPSSASEQSERAQPPPLPPPLGASTSCALAGGWCPSTASHDGAAAAGSHSNSLAGGVGQHKSLWPLAPTDWLGLGAAAAALALAASGGIGGGAILVPLYLMVLGERF